MSPKSDKIEWLPEWTAPKDGSEVLCYAPGNKGRKDTLDEVPEMKVDHWQNGGWWKCKPRNPYTHWMPLPAPPEDGHE